MAVFSSWAVQMFKGNPHPSLGLRKAPAPLWLPYNGKSDSPTQPEQPSHSPRTAQQLEC